MANIKISELNELYGHQRAYDDYVPIVDASADETKKISVKGLIPNNVNIIAVTDTAPVEYETGDKYYNTEENKVYTATSWGWENPETPIGGILYIILSEQKSYTYDWDNETLISVGGGGIAVAPDEPSEDTKLYIESTDLDFQGLEIANEYTTGDNVAYSANYINNSDSYSTNEVKTNKTWIDGKPIYRKVYTGTLNSGTIDYISTLDKLIRTYGSVSGTLSSKQYTYPIGHYIGSDYYAGVQYEYGSTSGTGFKIFYGSKFNGFTYRLVVEYTKTTD